MIYNRSFSSPFIQSNTYVHSGFIPMSHSFLFFVCFSWTFVPKATAFEKKNHLLFKPLIQDSELALTDTFSL